MKDDNNLLIGIIIIIAVAVFLFFGMFGFGGMMGDMVWWEIGTMVLEVCGFSDFYLWPWF